MAKTIDEKDQIEMRDDDAVRQLSRMPARCPVEKCGETVFPSNLMMHMLDKHAHDYNHDLLVLVESLTNGYL